MNVVCLVYLLVDGVQLGNLGWSFRSAGQVVGLGHQLKHLTIQSQSKQLLIFYHKLYGTLVTVKTELKHHH